jgi:hypothetical protein
VTTTDFFTRFLKNVRLELATALACLMLLAVWPLVTVAQTAAAEITSLRLEYVPDGIVLAANVRIELPPAVEDALLKGVAMFFVAEAEVVHHRWYWSDKKVAVAQRHMRLAYQPLTRRWRLNVASGVITPNSLGLALNLSFDTLAEAMATLQRISSWKIADAAQIDPEAIYKVDLRFSLDLTQLPRPFQIGAFGQSDWNISAVASQQIGPEGAK